MLAWKVYITRSRQDPHTDSVDPSHSVSEVWCFFQVWFWTYSLSNVNSDTAMFRRFYVLLDAAPCCSTKATLGEISTILGGSKSLLMNAQFHCHSCLRHGEVLLNAYQVLSSLIGQWISLFNFLACTLPAAF